jgi:hypothetical protein
MVMGSTKDGVRFDASGRLNRTRDRRIFIQWPVRSDLVVIAGISLQNPAQVSLAQDDDMVDALALDRSDQFGCDLSPSAATQSADIGARRYCLKPALRLERRDQGGQDKI